MSIIIVNWNGRELLEHCFRSLGALSYPQNRIKIILVDNGSTDDSVPWTLQNFPKVHILENKTNLGFAKANNIGMVGALGDIDVRYVITLNNDTEVNRNWLKNLVSFMEENDEVGIAVGKVLQFHNRDKIDSAGDFFSRHTYRVINRGHNEWDCGQYDTPDEVLSATAAASIFRRKTLEDTKMDGEFFDEDFVSYLEDVDLNIRARLKGWSCFYIPTAVVYHIGSATSSKVSRQYKEYLSRRNRVLMVVKNLPHRYVIFFLWRYALPSKVGVVWHLKRKVRSSLKKGLDHYAKKGLGFYIQLGIEWCIRGSDKLAIFEVCLVHVKALYGALRLLPRIIKKRKMIQRDKKVPNQEIERWVKTLVVS